MPLQAGDAVHQHGQDGGRIDTTLGERLLDNDLHPKHDVLRSKRDVESAERLI